MKENAILFCGMIAVSEELFREGQARLCELYGDIDIESDVFPFNGTDYYQPEMGDNLLRKFISFPPSFDPTEIAKVKLATNETEKELSVERNGTAARTINLDPGYVTQAKVVLATTKNFTHRIQIKDEIFAEVTMNFNKDGCVYHAWTYPDFKSEHYSSFFLKLRANLL